jgi:cbb3-type cytochrome oxidase subunit 3
MSFAIAIFFVAGTLALYAGGKRAERERRALRPARVRSVPRR